MADVVLKRRCKLLKFLNNNLYKIVDHSCAVLADYSADTGSKYSDAGSDIVRSILRCRIRNEGANNCSSPITTARRSLGRRCGRVLAVADLSATDNQTVAQPYRGLVCRRLASGKLAIL